jgi:hypothetical protein
MSFLNYKKMLLSLNKKKNTFHTIIKILKIKKEKTKTKNYYKKQIPKKKKISFSFGHPLIFHFFF